ncbi:NAD(P)/FAD-dependent oxidoreductase [Candidatus Rariloculus sp.]|uniref:NAD(P)/FAD-dependent oxidoreductase n=1 Tax=Candidatus Rariloculus sp. TaxID=3101265 RepID=UPI003D0EBED3
MARHPRSGGLGRVGIVGGGVIGLCTAYYLKKLGADPVLIESSTLGSGCSLGNGVWVVPSLATPLPAPGLTLKSLTWMRRRDSPLYIKPSALPMLAPWLMRFRTFCNDSDQKRGIAALAALNAVTMERYDEVAADGVSFECYESGLLMAFRESDRAAAAQKEVKLVAGARAAACRELDETELYEHEPMLRPGFRFGLFVGGGRYVRPESLTAGLASSLRASGVEIHEGVTATGFRSERDRVTAIVTSKGDLDVDAVVLAAGAHTGTLSRMAGWPIPLTAGKGYSVTIEQPTTQLRQPLYLGGVKIGLSPFNGTLRFVGTMELSGINRRMDAARIRSLRRQVSLAVDIPEASEGGRAWVGMRPIVPDSLPVIGKLPSRENAYVNTGHQMLGITLAPSSACALAGLMLEGKAGVGLEAFSARRF